MGAIDKDCQYHLPTRAEAPWTGLYQMSHGQYHLSLINVKCPLVIIDGPHFNGTFDIYC